MEKRTMAEVRREKFNKQGQIARDLADLALKDIDDALAEHTASVSPLRRPSEIGAVLLRPTFELPDPPEAA